MSKKEKKKHDSSIERHAIWKAAQAAGLLINGRWRVGAKIPDKKHLWERHICRKRKFSD